MTRTVNLLQDEITTTLCYHTGTNWEDLKFPVHSINPRGQVSDPDIDPTDGSLLFDHSSTEIIMGTAQIPHSWQEGTPLHPHIHWQETDTVIANVLWRFEYNIANMWESFSGSFTSIDMVGTSVGDANFHHVSAFQNINMGLKKLSCVMKWKLSRIGGDALDTYPYDVRLLEFDIHYMIGTVGSGLTYQK